MIKYYCFINGGEIMDYKKDFKFLNKSIIYFDNGATTLKPNRVIEKMDEYYYEYPSNAHRGDYSISTKASEEFENVRDLVQEFINAKTDEEIVFTSGSTESINMAVYGYFMHNLKSGDEVLITKSEHASVIIPWFDLENRLGIKVKYIDLNDDYTFSIDNFKKAITPNTKVISIAEITNVIGDKRNIKEITKIAHEKGIKVLVDASQSIGHIKVDVTDTDVDFLAFSAHKMLGPTGVGVLYGKKELLDEINYKHGGGTSVSFETPNEIVYKDLPFKLEAGTQNIAGVIGLGEAIKYLNEVDMDYIDSYTNDLKKYLVSKLKDNENIIMYNPDVEGSILIFNVKDVFAQDVAIYLNNNDICVRAGDHCDKKLHDVTDVKNTVRVSLYFYNTKEEIDKLAVALNNSNILEESLGI
jgi:cysteine desulfurase/selenocysteine lyase